MTWVVNETPPEVGTSAIVYLPGVDVVITATFIVGGWMSRGEQVFPSHWQPLPDRPRLKEGS